MGGTAETLPGAAEGRRRRWLGSRKAFVAALPGWKRAVATRIDEIIRREVPDVRSAVKWHYPFYGIEGQGWFASLGVFSKYLKLTFMRGASLEPVPPGDRSTPRTDESRSIDLRQTDALDEERLASWVRQAAAMPGWSGS